MIYSMTAFSRQTNQLDWGTLAWEIRSVNHRYLEPSFKLPDNMRGLEGALREALRGQLNRGKVECMLRVKINATPKRQLNVDLDMLKQLISASETIQSQLNHPSGIQPLQLLQWPGIIIEPEVDTDQVNNLVLKLFQKALDQLIDTRQREGGELKTFILQRLEAVADITQAIRRQLPGILQAQRNKLFERLQELSVELDTDRLEQEITLLAQKADVDEELDRLDAHIKEARRVLDKGGSCGRRLDFLMQEFNREANTLSSKSVVSDTTLAAVELKVLIEQMREQIQNIE